MTINPIVRVWSPPCGGTLTLTTQELLEDFRGVQARWELDDFIDKISDRSSLTSRLIISVYGIKIIEEILEEIQRLRFI